MRHGIYENQALHGDFIWDKMRYSGNDEQFAVENYTRTILQGKKNNLNLRISR
jgi:hypothetical protein